METLTLDLPTMYGDHHVIEVRRILLETPGVQDVYASSAFHAVEVTFDPAQTSADALRAKLEEAGYSGELPIPVEDTEPATEQVGNDGYFRHSAAFESTGNVVSFAHHVAHSGRPLWPCPGLGPLSVMDEGE